MMTERTALADTLRKKFRSKNKLNFKLVFSLKSDKPVSIITF